MKNSSGRSSVTTIDGISLPWSQSERGKRQCSVCRDPLRAQKHETIPKLVLGRLKLRFKVCFEALKNELRFTKVDDEISIAFNGRIILANNIEKALEYYKLREQDNASALPWDEISKVPYETWHNADFSASIKKENAKKPMR